MLLILFSVFPNVLSQRYPGSENFRFSNQGPFRGGQYGNQNPGQDLRFSYRGPYSGGQYGNQNPGQDFRFSNQGPNRGGQYGNQNPGQDLTFSNRGPYRGGQFGNQNPRQDFSFQGYRPQGNEYDNQNLPKEIYSSKQLYDQGAIDPKTHKVATWVFEELDELLTKYNKFDEFEAFSNQLQEKKRQDPSRTVEDELREIMQWSKGLGQRPMRGDLRPMPRPQILRSATVKPSPGMSAYWGEPEEKKPRFPTPGPNTPLTLTGQQVMDAALRSLASVDKIDSKSPMEKLPEVLKNLPKDLPMELIKENMNKPTEQTNIMNKFPTKDDFNSPIKWVPLTSNDTRDGLAKVTDPYTGKNQQFVLNHTVFVPVIDYNIERLGISTTSSRPILTTDFRSLRTVARNIDLKTADSGDWLAFEVALGGRNDSEQCANDGCQSRCKSLACESTCSGDTCASGCVGKYCNTFCRGPGCLSMCIGESCRAKCEGLSCQSRCRGLGCEASVCINAIFSGIGSHKCRTFSCNYVVNGKYGRGGGTWDAHYPQYDNRNIRNPYPM